MEKKKKTYSRVRSSKLVTAVGKGPTIDTAYTSLKNTKSQLPQIYKLKSRQQQLNLKIKNLYLINSKKKRTFFASF